MSDQWICDVCGYKGPKDHFKVISNRFMTGVVICNRPKECKPGEPN